MAKTKPTDTAATSAAATAIEAPELPADPMLDRAPAQMVPTRGNKVPSIPGLQVPGAIERTARRDANAGRNRILQHLKSVKDNQVALAGFIANHDAHGEAAAEAWVKEGVSIERVRNYEERLRALYDEFIAGT